MVEYDANNVFSKIISNETASIKVYEDSKNIVIMDVYPENPGHMLVIPKEESRNILDIHNDDLCESILIVKKITKAQIHVFGASGCKIKHNCESSAGQIVFHTHFHVIPVFEEDAKMPLKLDTMEKQANVINEYLMKN
ncbi:MAG: HIT domain-containing protein [Hyphomicrobiales bacterium]|jgi:histidine triad (HIT) family protein|nr:HIT domain-containing protein [Hyphomicrobiales bacterium]|tara:strand:+ start:657 stop:1070 length:414 start_codon:yes stop_codon:yes gene_type:complete